ncbi:M56 family metallopeptidase [Pedobacter sp. UC225_61]|uniref:M56 family metallopeptidase n=1 Tax=Pedobacter sp. UC225_61 TaxID=3374623 RepID=UPI00378CF94D
MMFYALNVALILAGCFLFYKVLLQKETFFPLNRFVLLGCLALSFSLPLIPVPEQWSFRNADNATAIASIVESKQADELPISNTVSTTQSGAAANQTIYVAPVKKESFFKDISIFKGLVWGYWLGVAVFGLNFLFQLCLLLYRSYRSPSIEDGRYRIVELTGDQAPCSFGNHIFINPEKYDWDTYSQIILHEKIHIQQGHSYDILLAELALIFQWFNPFAWFYRKAIEDNLEFLTDNELLEHSDVEKTSYQMSLVKVSAPHFPISLTTNYNQSVLKKRLIMMNAKKSSLNSTWKYLCILPLLLVFISLLNEPVAYGKTTPKTANKPSQLTTIPTKGSWFATIKGSKVKIRFEGEEDKNSNSNNDFDLSEFKNLPQNTTGQFSLTREAGTVQFTGRFDGNVGMGEYNFNANESYVSFLNTEGIKTDKEKDMFVFFLINIKKDFVTMLKSQGYTQLSKNDLIPLAALKVSKEYISSLKAAGLNELSLQNLIPLKALDIDAAFVTDIKNSGYKDVTASKLISLKAQGITGEDIKTARIAKVESNQNANANANKNANANLNANLNANTKGPKGSKGSKGDKNSDDDALESLIAKKAMNITPEFIKSFRDAGYKFTDEDLLAIKALGITPAFCKKFDAVIPNLETENYVSLKALGFTPEEYNSYLKLGFKKLDIGDVMGAKSTGVTPAFITEMRKKGRNYSTIDKYISLKVLSID